MTRDEYETALARSKSLMHGSAWKNHKYIRKEGDRYIYKENSDHDLNNRGSASAQNLRDQWNAAARAAGDAKSVIRNDKDADRAAKMVGQVVDYANTQAAKGYANDLTDALEKVGTDWLSGSDVEIDTDDYLDKLIADKGVQLDREGKKEVAKMAITQLIRRIDQTIADNPSKYDSNRIEQWNEAKKGLQSEYKTNTPYADRTAEIKDFEKKQKRFSVSHSFSSKEEFYAAVEQSKEELAHFGTKGMRWGFRRYQNEDGTLTPEGRARYNKKVESKAKSGIEKMLKRKIPKNASNKKIAYSEGVKAVGSTLLSAAVVATAVKNGKNIYKNINDKKYFKAAFDATKLASKVFVGAQLVANAIGHAKRAGMAIGVEQMKNDRAASEARKSAYMYGEANAKAKTSGSKADAQWTKTQESYRTLGSGPISRAVAARKNESPAAKEYNTNRSKAVNLSTQAKLDQARADELRRKSGRTKLERDYNMAKYGR